MGRSTCSNCVVWPRRMARQVVKHGKTIVCEGYSHHVVQAWSDSQHGIYGGFHTWGSPRWLVYNWKSYLGYPFGHFLFFWIFVASCLTSPGHRSTFDFKKIPGSSALDWGTIGRSFFLECSFQPLGCSFQPFFASFFLDGGEGWTHFVEGFCSLPLSGILAAARLARLLRLLRRACCCLGLQLLRPCCWRHCIIAGWAT